MHLTFSKGQFVVFVGYIVVLYCDLLPVLQNQLSLPFSNFLQYVL